jgi:hypothetical protein
MATMNKRISYHYHRPYHKRYAYTTTYCLCYFILLLLLTKTNNNNNNNNKIGVAIINAKPAEDLDYNSTTDYVDFEEEKDEENANTTTTTTEEEDVDIDMDMDMDMDDDDANTTTTTEEDEEEEEENKNTIYKEIIDDPFNLPDEPILFEYDLNLKGGQWNFILEYPISTEVVNDVQDQGITGTSIDIRLYDRGCLYNNGDSPVELVLGTTVNDPTFSPFDSATSVIIMDDDGNNNDDDFDYDYIYENSDKISVARLDMLIGGKIDDMTITTLLTEYPTLRTLDESDNNIEICVRTTLLRNNKDTNTNIEVNFIETIIVLYDIFVINDSTVVLVDAYTKQKENKQSSGLLSYGVDAYICNSKNLPIIADKTGLAAGLMYEVCHSRYSTDVAELIKPIITERISFPQGAIIRICAKPDKYSTGLVSITKFQTLLFEQVLFDDETDETDTDDDLTIIPFAYRQKSVENGNASLLRLSEMKCEANVYYDGEIVCAVDTLLRSEFFVPLRNKKKETSSFKLKSSQSLSSPDVQSYWNAPKLVKLTGKANLQFAGKNNNTDSSEERQRNLLLRREHHPQHQQEQDDRQQDQDQQFLLQRMLQQNTTMTATISTSNGQQQRRQQQEQFTFWDISIPTVVFDEIDGGSRLDFELLYSISDAITNDMIQIEIWTEGCEAGLDNDNYDDDDDNGNSTMRSPLVVFLPSSSSSSSSISASETTSSLIEISATDAIATGDGRSGKTQRFRTTIRWKVENEQFNVQLVGSDLFKEISDGFAQIALCVRTQLHTPSLIAVSDDTITDDDSNNNNNNNKNNTNTTEDPSIGNEITFR